MDLFTRAVNNLSLSVYQNADQSVMEMSETTVKPPDDQYILRMLIKSPETSGFVIPDELEWLRNTILSAETVQNIIRPRPYVYVTVRCGEVRTKTDDEWHVDGFSMRVTHQPETNYIWSDCYPTEVLNQKFAIPNDFDPMKHNLHSYFQKYAKEENVRVLRAQHVAIIDPYIVHRRPKVPVGVKRKFFRISFIPIEIEDDTCMQNPLLPKKVYNRSDIRERLIPYAASSSRHCHV